MKVRLFIAVDLPEELQDQIFEQLKSIRDAQNSLRWVPCRNLHLTVKFLGDTEESKIKAIEKALVSALEFQKPFTISFSHLGGFPNLTRCRVFWLGIKSGAIELISLKERIDQALVPAGCSKEPKSFVPHLTIARSKRPEGVRLAPREFSTISYVAHSVRLFESHLTSSGSIYRSRVHFSF